MPFDRVRVPGQHTPIYKDECVLTFKTPLDGDGLFVCMNTFFGFSRDCVEAYYAKTMNDVYLRIKATKMKKEPSEPKEDAAQAQPTKLAIGVEGGFQVDTPQFEVLHDYAIVTFPDNKEYALDSPDLPDKVKEAAAAIISLDSSALQNDTATWVEERKISAHADNLLQLDDGIKVKPGSYKCQQCDLTDNLWLNLTDGTILCGRRYYDGTGGNNHAVDHYDETKYPLAVKLGTITPDGADVYSYPEGDMVIDPYLGEHLAHFGIDILTQKKTEKTMVEMEIEANQKLKFEFDAITESGYKLVPAYGPERTGLINLGNSCYMNSVLQVLFSLEEFKQQYASSAIDEYLLSNVDDPAQNFNIQLHKVGYGLVSGDYSNPASAQQQQPGDEGGDASNAMDESPDEHEDPSSSDAAAKQDADSEDEMGISPKMFKFVVGKGHPLFSTGGQQDAYEFWAHLMSKVEENAKKLKLPNLAELFEYDLESLTRCNASNKVRLGRQREAVLSVPVRLDLAINKEEVEAQRQKDEAEKAASDANAEKTDKKPASDAEAARVKPIIPFEALVNAIFEPKETHDWYSSAIKDKTSCTITTGFSTFPKYLVCTVNRFYLSDSWVPLKHDVSVEVPDELDLSALISKGKGPDDEDLPEEEEDGSQGTQEAAEPNPDMVASLAAMGFPVEGCKKAVFHNPSNLEAAMEWVMVHMGDPDFADPFVAPSQQQNSKESPAYPPESIAMITAMGFTDDQAAFALKQTNGSVERAADWIFSHMSELDTLMAEAATAESTQGNTSGTSESLAGAGTGRYRLKAFISHLGSSTQSGHYVCHIKKDDQWLIFNDRKVAISQSPPRSFAYIYLFESV